jgi:oxygen-independent coproporphyrinogen-3 oxidase
MSLTVPSSVYIHLPFCKTKCPYCDFASFAGKNDLMESYQQALFNEIDFRLEKFFNNKNLVLKPKLETIFFGGGTPSLHEPEFYDQIFTSLKKFFDFDSRVEITLEANPGTINVAKLSDYKQVGINRISLGIQTFNPSLLEKLGRGHSLDDSFNIIEAVKSIGFNSWSFDLIYGLAKQSVQDAIQDFRTAIDFDPPHISAYALSIEKNTPYGEIFKNSQHPDLPPEEDLISMYDLANEIFGSAGLNRYEISNWSKPGHESRHNLCYWFAHEYFAFGLSAHGYIDSCRYSNTRDLSKYIRDFTQKPNSTNDVFYLCQETNKIEEQEKFEEKVMLNLRLSKGLILNSALRKKLNEKKIKFFLDEGFLNLKEQAPDTQILSLTHKGLLLSNKIIADLLP